MDRLNFKNDKIGTVYYDIEKQGAHLVVLRGPMSINAYLFLPHDHPWVKLDWDKDEPIEVHGGVTLFNDRMRPYKNMFCVGWDYAHYGDRIMYPDEVLKAAPALSRNTYEHLWTPDEVLDDSIETFRQATKICKN